MTEEWMPSAIDGHRIRIVRPLPSLVLEMARALSSVAAARPCAMPCPSYRQVGRTAGEQLLEPERALPRAG